MVLAYSGGLDTSVILCWLKDHYGCEVSRLLRGASGRAKKPRGSRSRKRWRSGASKLHLVDLREEFARDFVFPMMRANAGELHFRQ